MANQNSWSAVDAFSPRAQDCDDPQSAREEFESSEGLRTLLERLAAQEHGAWRHDREAAALMAHVVKRYAKLARKHGLDPWDAAAAAFDAMRSSSVRNADDPWAVVTRAVQVTMIAEERANGLLCSVYQARRPEFSSLHDPERFSDRENPLSDYHPSLRVESVGDGDEADDACNGTGILEAVDNAIAFLTLLGWPRTPARTAMEYICARLSEVPSRATAWESLRRDVHGRTLLDLSSASWNGLLRAVLGNPEPEVARTTAGRGILLRLLIGEPLLSLLADDDLVLAVSLAVPAERARR
ncbi:hypothetical protein R8Z57_07630 [Microbacterium sp. M3]|uniref:Serine/arginine repetitive matrix protein 2 n=1 Tax=Microbacterium arthrosphaerae TaxID=792652 RepID=A0ABU4H1T9_9MICO|nr:MULTISPECIES: hypothetical protein [Microbacterium]MDW4572645.1 hypothetical protein [Microbacterium arthrosphaerae]MDW7606500.1 hypothetical protein [Microbacterium sp. M3]